MGDNLGNELCLLLEQYEYLDTVQKGTYRDWSLRET